jgi:taurine dioxygenase
VSTTASVTVDPRRGRRPFGPRVAVRTPAGFDRRPYTRFAVDPCSPTIGAEIRGVDLGAPLDPGLRAELHRALLEWKVLFFRDQDITREQQRDFATAWGPAEQHPFFKHVYPGQTAPDVATLAKDAMTAGFENEWHTDNSWHARPSFGAVLRAVEVPPVGGDTLWSDLGAAYDVLPEDLRQRIDGLTAIHDWVQTFGVRMSDEVRERLRREYPEVEHPVVRVHPETGRRMLFVNQIFTREIVGLPAEEGEDLLRRLAAVIAQPELQVRFRWSPGAVAFWDNRSTHHYAVSDYHPARRVMDRISIAGDRPTGPTPV